MRKMKGLKRVAAMLLSVIMVLSAVNLPPMTANAAVTELDTKISEVQLIRNSSDPATNAEGDSWLVLALETNNYGSTFLDGATALSWFSDYETLNQVKIYTTDSEEPALLGDILATSGDTNIYFNFFLAGSIGFNITDGFDGKTITKVVVEKGATFPCKGDTSQVYVTSQDVEATSAYFESYYNVGNWLYKYSEDTSLSRVENDGGRMFFSLTNSDLASVANSTAFQNAELGTKYNMLDYILFYTTAGEYKTAREMLAANPDFQWNLWTRPTCVTFVTGQPSADVKFVLVKKGCEFPSYAEDANYGGSTKTTVYKTTTDIIFNMNGGSVSTTPILGVTGTEVATDLSDLAILKCSDTDYRLRVKLSPSDYASGAASTLMGADWQYRYNLLDMIDLYLSGQEEPVSLRTAATGNESYFNLWGHTGTFSLQMTGDYNGTTIEKVVFKKGCQLPSYNMEKASGTDVYVLEEEVVFESSSLTAQENSGNWKKLDTSVPYDTEVTQIVSGHNGGSQISFQLTASDYTVGTQQFLEFGTNGSKQEEYNFLENIKVHTTTGEVKTLKSVYTAGNSWYKMFDVANNVTIGLGTITMAEISKIEIPAGTVFPSYAYASGSSAKMYGYRTTEDKIFEQKADTTQTSPYSEAICWSLYEMEIIDVTVSVKTNAATGLGLLADKITSYPSGGTFTAYDENSVFTYTTGGVTTACTRTPRVSGSGACIWLVPSEISANASAVAGDIIELSGVWQYSVDSKYYNFGTVKYEFDGTSWEIWEPDFNEELLTLTQNVHYDATLTFNADKISNPTDDQLFTAASLDAALTYNGVASKGNLRMTSFGLFLNVSEMTGGTQTTANTNDVIKLTGIWQYTDGKYYDFGTVEYKWNGLDWVDVNAPQNIDTGITGVMIYDNSGKLIIQPSVSDYSSAANDFGITGDALTKLKEYNFFDKIKLSTEGTTKTLRKILGGADEYYYNLWSDGSIVIDMNDEWDAKSVTMITIESGCEFPAYAYTNGDSAVKVSYKTTEETSWELGSVSNEYNATYVRYYPDVVNDTSVTNVHVRVGKLLIFLSEHDYGPAGSTAAVDATKLGIYNILDNVYVSNGTEVKALKDVVTAEAPYYNIWGESGSIAFNLATGWDGTNITSVYIKAGTEFPAYAYTSGSATDKVKYVTSQDIEFNTTTESLGNENITWTAAQPRTEETMVTGIWTGHNGTIVTFHMTETDYEGLGTAAIGASDSVYNYLEKIRFYNAAGEVKTFKEILGTQKYYNMWGIGNSVSIDTSGFDPIRVVIPEGTVFPSSKYTRGLQSAAAGYEVTHELVFEKGTRTFTLEGHTGIDWDNVSTQASNVPADVNGDTKVSAVDIVTMMKYLDNGYRANETADCNVDDRIDEVDLDIVIEVILGRILHNYEKESETLPIFSSSNKEMDTFLNDFFKRHIGYNDYYNGDMTVTQFAVGDSNWQEGMFNFNWATLATTWFDSSDSGLGFDRTEGIKKTLEDVVVDRYGYVWDGYDRLESTTTNLDLAYHSMGWTFPNALQANDDGGGSSNSAIFWDFNVAGDPTKNYNSTGGSAQNTNSEWTSSHGATVAEGLYSQTVTNQSSVWFQVDGTKSYDTKVFRSKYAPWLAIDLRMTGIDHPENIEDIKISWTTERDGAFNTPDVYSVKVSEIASVNYDFTSDYAQELWIPMYTQSNWDQETTGDNIGDGEIHRLKIEVVTKSGTTISGTVSLNYVRPWMDTRHSDNNANFIESLRQYYTMTGDIDFVAEHITDARKAMNFLLQMYDEDKNLNRQSYLYGHNGSKTDLVNSLGQGYWDVYYTPVYGFTANMYFYEALGHLVFLEQALISRGVSAPAASEATVLTAEAGTHAVGSAAYTWTTSQLETIASETLTAMRSEFWNPNTNRYFAGLDNDGVRQDYGFLAMNLEALNAGIPTQEQANQIFTWLNTNHDDIYKFGFAPISNTTQSPLDENGHRDIYQYVVNDQLDKVVNMEFGESVQYGGAIMYTSFYDMMARLNMASTDDAYERLTEIKDWYLDGPLAYSEANPDTTKGKDFYTNYFLSQGIKTQNGSVEGHGNGAVGVDGEFIENSLLAAIVPYGFFGLRSTDGMTLSFEPELPVNMDFWKIENMQFHDITYDVTMYHDAIRIDSVRGEDGHAHNLHFVLDCPEGYEVYVDGVKTETSASDEEGKVEITIPFKDVLVEVLHPNYVFEAEPADLVDFVVNVESGREARVLQLTDTQIIDGNQVRDADKGTIDTVFNAIGNLDANVFDCMDAVVEEANPDLILVTGDLIYGKFDDNGTVLQAFIEKMDSYKIPWAPIFGNHENESIKGADWQCEQLEASKYCRFKQRELTGNGNYSVGIEQDGKLIRTFFMMDTNGCSDMSAETEANGHSSKYFGFGQDQIDWLTSAATRIRQDSPATKISMAFHTQMSAWDDAMETYGYDAATIKANPINLDEDATAQANGDFGYIGRQTKNPWDTTGNVWALIKSLGVDSIFVGHEHCNSASILYDGIRLTYGLKTGVYDRANYKKTDGTIEGFYGGGAPAGATPIIGGTKITIASNGKATVNHVYYEQ